MPPPPPRFSYCTVYKYSEFHQETLVRFLGVDLCPPPRFSDCTVYKYSEFHQETLVRFLAAGREATLLQRIIVTENCMALWVEKYEFRAYGILIFGNQTLRHRTLRHRTLRHWTLRHTFQFRVDATAHFSIQGGRYGTIWHEAL